MAGRVEDAVTSMLHSLTRGSFVYYCCFPDEHMESSFSNSESKIPVCSVALAPTGPVIISAGGKHEPDNASGSFHVVHGRYLALSGCFPASRVALGAM